MTEIMPVPRNSNITVLRPPSISPGVLLCVRIQLFADRLFDTVDQQVFMLLEYVVFAVDQQVLVRAHGRQAPLLNQSVGL